jgi:hypothetical protein
VPETDRICPSCAGQLTAETKNCPWCGAGTLAADGLTTVGAPPPSRPPTRPDVGFGDGTSRPLPPIPPPPAELPRASLNPAQIVLRTLIVLAAAYLIVTFGHNAIQMTVCMVPRLYAYCH